MKYLLVTTEIDNIKEIRSRLEEYFNIIYLPDSPFQTFSDIEKEVRDQIFAIFTNPNNSKIKLNNEFCNLFENLRIICTASTGTVHIDLDNEKKDRIKILSLKNEIETLKYVSSTAELAFLFLLSGVRNFLPAINDVKAGEWDCEKFIGRQINKLNIGIIGFGRLGKMFGNFSKAFEANLLIYDPYITAKEMENIEFKSSFVDDIKQLCENSDVISLHIHVSPETRKLINDAFLQDCKSNLILINTSRGEVVDEDALLRFLKLNKDAKYFTDVLENEIEGKHISPILRENNNLNLNNQIFVTPHIGGMTHDARYLAYNRAVDLLINNIKE